LSAGPGGVKNISYWSGKTLQRARIAGEKFVAPSPENGFGLRSIPFCIAGLWRLMRCSHSSVRHRLHAILHLVLGDNPADDRSLPIVIRGNQSSSAIVQFQCWISQRIQNVILTELRANGTQSMSQIR